MKGLCAVYKRGITSSTLKWIAIITMIIDHIGAALLEKVLIQGGILEISSQFSYNSFMENYGTLYHIYEALRMIGRISFPIFCFLIVQGFLHTHDVKKYLKRMFLFALLSEIPFDLAFSDSLFDWEHQNVFFTLFFGILALTFLEKWKDQTNWKRYFFSLLSILFCILSVYVLKTDYDIFGILAIVIMYLFRKVKIASSILGCGVLMEPFAFLSVLPIQMYNGQKGRSSKWFFYAFYPLHLIVLYVLGKYWI